MIILIIISCSRALRACTNLRAVGRIAITTTTTTTTTTTIIIVIIICITITNYYYFTIDYYAELVML